jgi:hypothetical protein
MGSRRPVLHRRPVAYSLYEAREEGEIALLASGFPSSMSGSAVSYSSMKNVVMFALTAALDSRGS